MQSMPMTVLIVDDHPSFRATARALLEAEGFEVVGEAADGAEALELVARMHPRSFCWTSNSRISTDSRLRRG